MFYQEHCIRKTKLCTNKQKQKLHKVIMSATRTIIGNYCYKKSIKYISTKCKMQDINYLLNISTLEFIHKALFYQILKSMLKYYNLGKISEIVLRILPFINLSLKS